MNKRYKLNIKQALLVGLVATLGFSSCKKFLDVNQNPNNPDSATPDLLLPTVEAGMSQVIGNSFQVYGNIWAQYWTQNPGSSQYRAIDQYNVAGTAFDRPWLTLYRTALINADLITKSQGVQLEYYKGIAYIMKAYAFQVTTDAFGDVPVQQALAGSTFPSPKYDAQKIVYDSIFAYIDKGIALINTPSATSPGNQDMVYQGNMNNWKAFANTLKLRAYLRLSKIDPTRAQAGIQSLYQTNPTFLSVDASIKYTSAGGNENPFYNEMISPTLNKTQNVVASSTAVDQFTANNDPRGAKFYDLLVDKVGAKDTLTSIPQGSYAANTGKRVSPPSALVGGRADNAASATAPVKLISVAESYFLQAEAVARGWTNGTGNLTALYTLGVTASFTATGAGDPTTYLATAPAGLTALTTALTINDKVKAIITQKYFAMCGFQGFEAWTEWRRTGYPTFLVQSAASIIGAGKMPLRMVYPNSEATTNVNYPGTQAVSVPVWWGSQ